MKYIGQLKEIGIHQSLSFSRFLIDIRLEVNIFPQKMHWSFDFSKQLFIPKGFIYTSSFPVVHIMQGLTAIKIVLYSFQHEFVFGKFLLNYIIS